MEEVKLRPNDRIQLGPSALFLYKNRSKEAEQSRPDTEEDPISFDFAQDEVRMADQGISVEDQVLAAETAKQAEKETKEAIEKINNEAKQEGDKAK
jgi:hypothetical protein